jgi:HD superfamily phosphohydrolase
MAEERKEIQLMDPLYEPTIMYSIIAKDLPLCSTCMKIYSTIEFQGKYRNLIRHKVKDKLKETWEEDDLAIFDFEKSIERQLRTKDIEKPLQSATEEALKERETSHCIGDHPEEIKVKHYGYNLPNIAFKELYDLYTELVNTFEMQRLMHLQMTGFLSFKYPSSTHTRFAHVIGTWISGLVALQNVTVVTEEGEEKRLLEFLADEDMHREFMAALILHDIGHAPFSHVLEMNPQLKYEHEEITESLIKGGHSSNYLELEDLLVSSYVDLEYGFNEEYGISQTDICEFSRKDIRKKEKFVLVHDVIKSMGLDEDIIVELFTNGNSEDPAVRALKGLVHGVIDIDRIDHIYRDLHYNSFKTMGIPLTSLFHGMKLHYGEEPWIEISEAITPIVETLLAAREQSNKAIFDNPVNNFYIGALNAAISDGVIMMPLFKYYIPYLTDEALLHVLMNKNLFHNLSPTKKIGIVTGSSFGHQDYRYSTYKIRAANRKIPNPDKDQKTEILKCISEVAEGEDIMWYAFLRNVMKDYGLKGTGASPTNIYIGDREKGGEKLEIRLEKYIEGITWDGDIKRSYTFTFFWGKDEGVDIEKIKTEIENGLKNIDGKLKIDFVEEGLVR